jgi:hypothetical protein
MANICSLCGVDMEVWGRHHNCNPREVMPVSGHAKPKQHKTRPRGAYKYRDKESRKAYMREFMRNKRNEAMQKKGVKDSL